jgi:hypothetical protein
LGSDVDTIEKRKKVWSTFERPTQGKAVGTCQGADRSHPCFFLNHLLAKTTEQQSLMCNEDLEMLTAN